MARYIGPVCKLCRREGMKLYLKADRCYSEKCAITRRPKPPGQHGDKRIKLSEYGIRLREKQKLRRIYGVLERQFRRYFATADRTKGRTGENLLGVLERRLDNIVHRMGFAGSRNEGRQIVLHKHVLVNGKRVNIPSYLVRPGDTVEAAPKAKLHLRLKASVEAAEQRGFPEWVEVDAKAMKGVFKTRPTRADLPSTVNENLVVELYSK